MYACSFWMLLFLFLLLLLILLVGQITRSPEEASRQWWLRRRQLLPQLSNFTRHSYISLPFTCVHLQHSATNAQCKRTCISPSRNCHKWISEDFNWQRKKRKVFKRKNIDYIFENHNYHTMKTTTTKRKGRFLCLKFKKLFFLIIACLCQKCFVWRKIIKQTTTTKCEQTTNIRLLKTYCIWVFKIYINW